MDSQDLIPRFHKRLLKTICREPLYDELAGDLEESFEENFHQFGVETARRIYKREVLKMIRPSVMKSLKKGRYKKSNIMFANYFRVSLRNIRKDRQHTLISVVGLATGLLASILVFQYAAFENSYDSFHNQANGDIFRVSRESVVQSSGEVHSKTVHIFKATHPTISEQIPEISTSTHLFPNTGVFSQNGTSYSQDKIHFTTASLFDVFSFKLLRGNKTDLDQPGSVFLSKSFAQLIFGEDNVIGKTITYNSLTNNLQIALQIKGIFEDLPANSHIKSEAFLHMGDLTSRMNFGQLSPEDVAWRWLGFHTYLKSRKDASAEVVARKLDELVQQYREPYDSRAGRQTYTALHKLEDIHFISDYRNQMEPSGNRQTITIFRFIGILTIVLAWINFVNLTSAKAVRRAREVGVRKTLGAQRPQLIAQFLTDALLVNLLALFLAVGLLFLIIPTFHSIVGAPVFDYFSSFTPFWTWYLALFILGALLSGVYPALVLSRFRPIAVLRGNFQYSESGIWLRKGLMFLQFSMVLIILSGIGVIRSQVLHLMDYDIGMDVDNTLVVNSPPPFLRDSLYNDKVLAFTNQLSQIPGVEDYSISSLVPGTANRSGQTASRDDVPSSQSVFLYRNTIDQRFLEFYDVKTLAGAAFNASLIGQDDVVVINEKAASLFEFDSLKEALQKKVSFPGGDKRTIIGVIGDFHHLGMKSEADPLVLELDKDGSGNFISVKVAPQNLTATIGLLEETYRDIFSGAPFDAIFTDQTFRQIYEKDKQFELVVKFFAIVAILIACLGTLGLSSYLINQKIKEISIRKVLGASMTEIFKLLTKEYIKLVLLSAIVAIPISFLLINTWLNTFLIRIPLSPLFFVTPVAGLLVVIFVTIGNKTRRAAIVNPARTLKNE